jgi:hypothetical protein
MWAHSRRADGALGELRRLSRIFFSTNAAVPAEELDSWQWTRARVVAELRRAAGRARRISAVQAGSKLTQACIRRFGSFAGACRAAGLETTRTKRRA